MAEDKKPNEFTKDEIFNMSDEDFEKNFNALPKDDTSFASFFQQDTNNEPSATDNQPPLDNQTTETGSNEGNVFDKPKVDESKSDTDKSIDKDKNFWNNFNNVNQDDTSSNIEEPKSSDENTPDDDSKAEEPSKEEQPQPQIHKVKAYGQTMNFTTDELIKLAPKALHFTKKLQALAPFRRSISAMQENNITEDDLNQFIEMKKGNKTAIANFMANNHIDAYDVSAIDSQEAIKYQPLKYGREQNELNRVIEELQEHPRSGELTNYVASLDQVSKDRLVKNPDVLEVLMSNIENGYFEVIQPEANKRAFLDGNKKPMIEYYAEVAGEYYKYLDSLEAKKNQQQSTQKDIQNMREKAKVSGNTGIKTVQKQPKQITSPYDISDEELEAFEKQMKFI